MVGIFFAILLVIGVIFTAALADVSIIGEVSTIAHADGTRMYIMGNGEFAGYLVLTVKNVPESATLTIFAAGRLVLSLAAGCRWQVAN